MRPQVFDLQRRPSKCLERQNSFQNRMVSGKLVASQQSLYSSFHFQCIIFTVPSGKLDVMHMELASAPCWFGFVFFAFFLGKSSETRRLHSEVSERGMSTRQRQSTTLNRRMDDVKKLTRGTVRSQYSKQLKQQTKT